MSVTDPWIVRRQRREPPLMRLFCFPYAGGGASSYYAWPEALPPEIEVCAIQLPGRESRISEKAAEKLDTLVATLGEQLRSYLDVPFALFGHSMGALIAFELARHLRSAYGMSAAHLIVSARRAPRIEPAEPPVHTLPETELIAWLRELNGIPEEIIRDAEFMRVMVPVFRADFALCETCFYRHEWPLSCDVTALGGNADPHVRPQDLEGWRAETTGRFSVCLFPGDHFFIRSAARQVLDTISRCLQPHRGAPARGI